MKTKELNGKLITELTKNEKRAVNHLIASGLAGIDKKSQTVVIFN